MGQYTVFPNPTTGQFSLKGGLTSGPVEAVIFDAYGRDVFRQIIDFQAVGTVGFEQGLLPGAGIYFLKIMENGSPLWQERLVVTGN